jgi:hypothetical protein
LQQNKTGNVLVTIHCAAFLLTLRGFAVLGNYVKSGALAWLWETSPFMGNAATLVVRGNISLNISVAFSEKVTEFSAVV